MSSYCRMKEDLTWFNNRVKWSYYGTLSAAKKYLKKAICVFAQEPYGSLQRLFSIFVRSVENDLKPSQTYDEISKLLLQQ